MSPKPRRGDIFGDISSLKHLATLLCWTFCNRLKVVTFPVDLAQFRGYR